MCETGLFWEGVAVGRGQAVSTAIAARDAVPSGARARGGAVGHTRARRRR
jgi:hypothetical protein